MSCGFRSGKVFCGQTSPNWTFLLEITDAVSSGLKRSSLLSACSNTTYVKFTFQDFKHDLGPICMLTSSLAGQAVIGGKSAGDQHSSILMCELLNDASKRLVDSKQKSSMLYYLDWSADSTP